MRDFALSPFPSGFTICCKDSDFLKLQVFFPELLRRCASDFLDVYYYKQAANGKEVDFVVWDKNEALELIQVSYDIDSPKAYNRETSALVLASETLKCDNLTLITFSDTRDVTVSGKTIHIKSAIEWLLA